MGIVGSAREISTNLVIDADFHRKYTSIYEVITDDRSDGAALVMTASGIPKWQDRYVWHDSFDDWAFVDSLSSSLKSVKDSMKYWTVTVGHSTPKTDGNAANARDSSGGTRREDPVLEPIRISGSFSQFQRPETRDKDDNPLVNVNEEPFIPAIEIDDSRRTLIIEANSETIDLEQWSNFSDKVNEFTMWGLEPRTIKLNQWSWDVKYYGNSGGTYIHNVLEFHINLTKNKDGATVGWTHEVLNQGYLEFTRLDSNGKRQYRPILKDDHRHTHAALLDEDGFVIVTAENVAPIPHYLEFKIYKEVDFLEIDWLPDPLPGPFV